MNAHFRNLVLAAALCGGWNGVAKAQTAPQTPVANETKITREIRVKNVSPSLMAWWIDSKNHAAPPQFQNPGRPQRPVADPSQEPVSVWLQGIDRIVANDAQKALLVFGTPTGIAEIEKMVAFLDQPLRQVEIETQWVQISREDAKAFSIETAESDKPNSFQIGFMRGNYRAILQRLVTQNKAKILTSPRVTTINNLSGRLQAFNFVPSSITLRDAADPLAKTFEGQTKIGIEYQLAATPTINNDDTITVLMSTSAQLKLATQNGTEFSATPGTPSVETIVNTRDGETVALMGLSSPTPNAAANIVIFVTPRIVRRAEDDVKPAAAQR